MTGAPSEFRAGRKWLFPQEETLGHIERKARIVGNVDRETALFLVRAIRGQRRAIEKLVSVITKMEQSP